MEDLLRPTDTSTREAAEAQDPELGSFTTPAEAIAVVGKLLSGEAPGVEEVRPEDLKSLDVELSLLLWVVVLLI